MDGIRIYGFGVYTALGTVLFLVTALLRARGNRKRDTLSWMAAIGIPVCLILSRITALLCDLDNVEDFPGTFFDFTTGGYNFYGVLLGMAVALAIACKQTGISFSDMADLLAPGFFLFAAVLVWGEGMTGGGYGWPVEEWFQAEDPAMSLFHPSDHSMFTRFPFAVEDPVYGGSQWAVFVPFTVALLAFGVVISKRTYSVSGSRALVALALYASSRVLYESLRQDQVLTWGFVRGNQILSAAVLIAVLILFGVRGNVRGAVGGLALMLVGAALVGAMEFAVQGKIAFLEPVPTEAFYFISAAGCMLLYHGAVLPGRPFVRKESL